MPTRRTLLKSSALLSLSPSCPASCRGPLRPRDRSGMAECSSCSSSMAATTGSTPSSPSATRGTRNSAASCGFRPTSSARSARGSACIRPCGRRPTCSRAGGWRSCRGSVIRTRTGRTSRAWPSGKPPGSTAARRPRRGGSGRALDAARPVDGPAAVHVGDQALPRALVARRAVTHVIRRRQRPLACRSPPGSPDGKGHGDGVQPDDLASFVNRVVTGAYRTAAELDAATSRGVDGSARYPETELAKQLRAGGPVDQVGLAGAGVLRDPAGLRHARRPVARPRAAPARALGRVRALPRRPRRGEAGRSGRRHGLQRVRPPARGERLARHRPRHRRPRVPRRAERARPDSQARRRRSATWRAAT